ncbi:MAG: cytochrome c [Burkholderiaceae bacterium]
MTRAIRAAGRLVAVLALLIALLAGLVTWLNVRDEKSFDEPEPPLAVSAEHIARGRYLAQAGNCIGCHTKTGGATLAGGRGVGTPFGVVVAPNITPDVETGIGAWSAADFWRAMHHGRAKDGRLLYPAFPYPSFTYVTREDSDALYAYLRTVPAVEQPNAQHALRFPYDKQAALAVWRALYFKPGRFETDSGHDPDWNRGRYLVQGLGHCAVCHSSRNTLGGTAAGTEFAGGPMPDSTWYAPSLASPAEAGVQEWPRDQVVELLRDGVSAHATASGPMAEVVFTSTQYLSDSDLEAMARYLASIPVRAPAPRTAVAGGETLPNGGKLYDQHCASCHGSDGKGVGGIYPALAGNRAVMLASPTNVVQIIRQGGFPPTTAGNPRPFGMPPYGQVLSDKEIAAVATFIRQSWGNAAPPVSSLDVLRLR